MFIFRSEVTASLSGSGQEDSSQTPGTSNRGRRKRFSERTARPPRMSTPVGRDRSSLRPEKSSNKSSDFTAPLDDLPEVPFFIFRK